MKKFCQFILLALLVSLAGQTAQAQEMLTIKVERVVRVQGGIDAFEFEVSEDVTDLDLRDIRLTSITLPEGLENLEILYLGGNDLITLSLPEGMVSLKTLELGRNSLLSLTLPKDLANLETLNLIDNNLVNLSLPEGLKNLKRLDISRSFQQWDKRNRLNSLTLPADLVNLSTLNLGHNRLKSLILPVGFPCSDNRLQVNRHNRLKSLILPVGLTNLTTLNLNGNRLTSLTLPEGLTNLETLDLGNNGQNSNGPLSSLVVREDLAERIRNGNVSLIGFNSGDVTIYTPPALSISRMDGIREITWNSGVLQSTTDLFGEWQDLESAESPLRILFPSEAMRFFRLRL